MANTTVMMKGPAGFVTVAVSERASWLGRGFKLVTEQPKGVSNEDWEKFAPGLKECEGGTATAATADESGQSDTETSEPSHIGRPDGDNADGGDDDDADGGEDDNDDDDDD